MTAGAWSCNHDTKAPLLAGPDTKVVLPTRRATASHTDLALNGERPLRSNSLGRTVFSDVFLIRLIKKDLLPTTAFVTFFMDPCSQTNTDLLSGTTRF